MTRPGIRPTLLIAASALSLAIPPLVSAQTESRLSADVSATAGYSSNPYLVRDGDSGVPVVTLDVAPRYQLVSARSTLTLSGDVNVQRYLRRYDGTENYAAALDYVTRASEHVTVHGRLDGSSTILGSNYYLPFATIASPNLAGSTATSTGTDGATTATGAATVVVPVTTATTPAIFTDIGLYGQGNRRNVGRASGDVNVVLSARDSAYVTGYGEVSRYGGSYARITGLDLSDYDAYGGSLGYQRRVSRALSLGVRGSASSYDYRNYSASNTRVYSLAATANGQLSERWTLDGSLGVSFVSGNGAGSTTKTSPSGSISLCRRTPLLGLCAQASRQVSPTGLVGSQYVTSAGASYSRQLDHHQSVSVGGSYSDVGGDNLRGINGVPLIQNQYAQAFASYTRQLGTRLRLLAQGTYRSVFGGQNGTGSDVGGQVGLSYRIGDRR